MNDNFIKVLACAAWADYRRCFTMSEVVARSGVSASTVKRVFARARRLGCLIEYRRGEGRAGGYYDVVTWGVFSPKGLVDHYYTGSWL